MSWGTQTQICFFPRCPQFTKQQLNQQLAQFRHWGAIPKTYLSQNSMQPPPYPIDSHSWYCVPRLLTSLHLHDNHHNESQHQLSHGLLRFPSSWALCTPETLSVPAAQRCQSGLTCEMEHPPLGGGYCWVAQSCPTLCDPMDCSTPGFPVLHHPPKFA